MWPPHIIISACGAFVGGIYTLKSWAGGVRYDAKCVYTLYGKTAIVTGANTGIGKETAKDLAKRGAKVILACRDIEKCEEAKLDIYQYSFNKSVKCKKCDLSSIASIRLFAKQINEEEKHVDILVNNAGVMFCPKTLTADGFEWHLGVNHLGHFLLTNLLLDKIKKSQQGRIITLTSPQYKKSSINFEDLNSAKNYSPKEAYGQSKLALVLFNTELAKQLEGTNVTANLVYPGLVKTDLMRHTPAANSMISKLFAIPIVWLFYKVPWQGSQGVLWAAVDPNLSNVSGKYFHNKNEKPITSVGLDNQVAKRLWRVSEKWTRLSTA